MYMYFQYLKTYYTDLNLLYIGMSPTIINFLELFHVKYLKLSRFNLTWTWIHATDVTSFINLTNYNLLAHWENSPAHSASLIQQFLPQKVPNFFQFTRYFQFYTENGPLTGEFWIIFARPWKESADKAKPSGFIKATMYWCQFQSFNHNNDIKYLKSY
jgi:hypothetical protein